jgi:hypothetical protein
LNILKERGDDPLLHAADFFDADNAELDTINESGTYSKLEAVAVTLRESDIRGATAL